MQRMSQNLSSIFEIISTKILIPFQKYLAKVFDEHLWLNNF